MSRALHVPHMGGTCGLSQPVTASRNRCSTGLFCPCHVVPKLTNQTQAPPAGLAPGSLSAGR
jgi:hypothetical protein